MKKKDYLTICQQLPQKFCMMLIMSSNPDFSEGVSLVIGSSFCNRKLWDMTCTSPVCSQLQLKLVKAVV